MRHFYPRLLARIALCAATAAYTLGCSSDDHGPPIGAPTGPVVITEGGGSGSVVGNAGASAAGGDITNGGGSFNSTGSGGADPFGAGGSGTAGADPFAAGGSGNTGGDTFSVAGFPANSGGSSF